MISNFYSQVGPGKKQISIKNQKENEVPVKTRFCLPTRGGAAVVVLLPSSTIRLSYLFFFLALAFFFYSLRQQKCIKTIQRGNLTNSFSLPDPLPASLHVNPRMEPADWDKKKVCFNSATNTIPITVAFALFIRHTLRAFSLCHRVIELFVTSCSRPKRTHMQ